MAHEHTEVVFNQCMNRLISGDGSPEVSKNRSWDRTLRTRAGRGSVMISFAVRRDGRRFQRGYAL